MKTTAPGLATFSPPTLPSGFPPHRPPSGIPVDSQQLPCSSPGPPRRFPGGFRASVVSQWLPSGFPVASQWLPSAPQCLPSGFPVSHSGSPVASQWLPSRFPVASRWLEVHQSGHFCPSMCALRLISASCLPVLLALCRTAGARRAILIHRPLLSRRDMSRNNAAAEHPLPSMARRDL